MEELELYIRASLSRLENRIERWKFLALRNAVLMSAQPNLVLPSPSVGLMEIESERSLRLAALAVLRSVAPLSPHGEVTLSIPDPNFTAGPWKVVSSSLSPHESRAPVSEQRGQRPLAKGIRIVLSRSKESSAASDMIYLYVAGGPLMRWALATARAVSGQYSLECRRPPLPLPMSDVIPSHPGCVLYHLASLSENILVLGVPRKLLKGTELAIDLKFRESIPISADLDPLDVRANVAPVWNSLDHRYPEFSDSEQNITEGRQRTIHPLTTQDRGAGWMPWSLKYVGGSGGRRARLSPGRNGSGTGGRGSELPFYLAYVPLMPPASGGNASLSEWTKYDTLLSVILSPEARECLDAHGEHLEAVFRATMGSQANDLPAGTEFQGVSATGLILEERIIGRLVGTTWGGSDGLTSAELPDAQLSDLCAVMPVGNERTVGHVMTVLERYYGHDLELVDERDLLRSLHGDCRRSLLVRVRFRQADVPQNERRVILESCQAFLNQYLSGAPMGAVRLVDADTGEDNHDD